MNIISLKNKPRSNLSGATSAQGLSVVSLKIMELFFQSRLHNHWLSLVSNVPTAWPIICGAYHLPTAEHDLTAAGLIARV